MEKERRAGHHVSDSRLCVLYMYAEAPSVRASFILGLWARVSICTQDACWGTSVDELNIATREPAGVVELEQIVLQTLREVL